MPVTKVVEIIDRAQTLLQDNTATRWPRIELQKWLNDAYKEIILARPDAYAQSAKITLSPGTRQSIAVTPAGALRLMDVVRNTAPTSAKRGIRAINRRILDEQMPDWHSQEESVDIQHFIFDPKLPKEFLVYPPALATAEIEIVYSSVPTPHALTDAQLSNAATADTIKLDDVYANAILDYVLYRGYSKDASYAGNAARASQAYAAFSNSLGLKSQVDGATAPTAQQGGSNDA